MYLHIGKDIMVKKTEIIGIFEYETLKTEKNFQKLCNKIQQEGKIEDISQGNQKTIILLKKQGKTKAYISNISSVTLAKRNTI